MSACSSGTRDSGLNSVPISFTCSVTGFFAARISPLLPVRRVSCTKSWQLFSRVATSSSWSHWAARLFSFCWVTCPSWVIRSSFLASRTVWSCWMLLWICVSMTWRWSLIWLDRASRPSRALHTVASCCSTGWREAMIASLCLVKASRTRSYWWSRWTRTMQSRQISSSHDSQ